jgi:hypothetical protein
VNGGLWEIQKLMMANLMGQKNQTGKILRLGAYCIN